MIRRCARPRAGRRDGRNAGLLPPRTSISVYVAGAVAAAGDRDRRARELAAEAEEIARAVTNLFAYESAMASVAGAVAAVGDYDRGEEIARSLIDGRSRELALASVAGAVAAAGDHDRGEEIARSLTDPLAQATALAGVASTAEAARARSCIAGALIAGPWSIPLKALAGVDPVALRTFVDEWTGLRAAARPLDNGPLSRTSAPCGTA